MANVRIRDQGKLTLKDSDNSNSVSLQVPSTVSSSQDFIVPNADGAANTIITTNASGGAGAVSHITGSPVGYAGGRVSSGAVACVLSWRCVVSSVPFFASLVGLFLCACGVAFGLASPFVFASGFLFACSAVCSLLARLGF